jgi:hypothetical protein
VLTTPPLQVCGAMTGGGSESIVSAVFASLAAAKETRGIAAPEIVIADSAHAAYYKAARYAGAKCATPLCCACVQAGSTLRVRSPMAESARHEPVQQGPVQRCQQLTGALCRHVQTRLRMSVG